MNRLPKENRMGSLSEDLAQLHALRLDLEEVEEMQRSGPVRIAAQERVANRKQEEHDQQKQVITNLRKAADEKSLQLKSIEVRIGDFKIKLNAAASNREYEIIASQIEADTMAGSVLEDEILEALEKVDAAQAELVEIERAHGEMVKKQKQTAAEVAVAAPGLAERAAELNEKIQLAERSMPASALDAYRRLVAAHGAAALANVEGDACTSCYSQVSPQERVALNLAKVVFCNSCGRMLYRTNDSGA